ncbi:formylglycine-generating enzyme family protein [Phaeodactylibacter xiamenensis]|uniref:formylglycine-generating enzyme family protein n=1 Tax=Phaeodactylibacter xiamenensis TaxID=1524460 RepID=UPI0024A9948C|nr:formylglycine-generating enzyme family protein [Phaeodactylibacter xiamenensis]
MPKEGDYHIETINNHTFRLRFLPSGIFDMGSNETEKALGKESPIHQVELSPFYIGEYPVTQALWKAVMGADHNLSKFIGDARPVEQVSWFDIVKGNQGGNGQPAFLQQLNEGTKTSRPKGYAYRLPTEAEWEYAARGGEQVRMDAARGSEPYEYAGSDQLKEVGWYKGNSHGETKAVGMKWPNGFHLYDMSGNVSEWCMDRYSNSFYQECYDQGVVKDPLYDDKEARGRVHRGGSFRSYPQKCHVSNHGNGYPPYRFSYFGFRLVLAPVQR